jgi:LysR family transcriptional regulator, glycine cleavage system transcriptional activator
MRSDLPPLTWLRAFEAAARTLSFTHAGAELNVTQAAISKHIKALELSLGQALFLRHPRSLTLTKSGAAYLPKVQDALERLAIGTREVFGHRKTQALTLRCAISFAVNWLAPRLPDFLQRYPGKEVRVISSVWNDAFDKDAFDLDIQYGRGNWPGFVSTRLTWEKITPLCAPDMAARSALKSPDDLRDHRLLHVMGYQEGWGIWLQAAGARQVNPGQGVQLDSSLIAFAVAMQGGGIALGRSSLATRLRHGGQLIAPFDLEVPIAEAFYLLQPADGVSHGDAGLFTDWLLDQVVADRDDADISRTTG